MKIQKLSKRILAYTLTLAILLSSLVFGAVSATAEDTQADVWSGEIAIDFAGGEGTADSPYLIENGEQLYKMIVEYSTQAESEGKCFKITKDIYLNDVADGTHVKNLANKNNWLAGYTDETIAAPSKANSFYGTLDGDGHTIYGLYAYGEETVLGLFPGINSATVIKNLNFDNLYINGANSSGAAIAGAAYYYTWQKTAQISYCSVKNAVIGQDGNMEFAAGLVADTHEVKVNFSNCYVTGSTFSDWTGGAGFVANDWDGGATTYNNCYSTGYYPVSVAVNKATISNVYTNVAAPEGIVATGIVTLTDDQMKGDAAKANMSGFDFVGTWQTVEGGYPVIRDEILGVWDGTKDYNLEGTGTEADPYLVKTAAHIAAIATGSNSGAFTGKYFKLANDIRINDTTNANWKDSARNWVWADFRFVGTFDGDGHTIDGLYYNGSQRVMGLFSYVGADNDGVYKTTLKNFKMTNAYIESTAADGAGFAAGQASRVAYFDGIYIDDTCEINSTVKGAGGILGQSGYNVFMSNIAMNGKVVGGSNVGAFAGTLSSGARLDIKSSYTTADLYAQGVTDRNLADASGAVYALKKEGTVDSVVTVLTADQMKGENAKTYMTGFSFKYVWETVENDYPVYNPRGELWDGSYVTDFSTFKGSGTAENPYLIENGAQLYYAAIGNANLTDGSCYKLVADIVLNDTSVAGWEASAQLWGMNKAKRFNGTLDGNGHTIEGLCINVNSTEGRYGLFSYVGQDTSVSDKVCEIKNITFKGASVTNTTTTTTYEGVGIVAGQASGETVFENIYIDDTSKVYAPSVKGVAGIVARSSQKVTINNCAVHGTYTGGNHVSSFMGTFWGGSQYINNSYSAANVPVTTSRTPTIVNVYATVKTADNYYDNAVVLLTADQMKGEAARENMVGFDFDFFWKTVENGYPVLRPMDERLYAWDGSAATTLKGEGTKENPYKISNGAELYYAIVTYSNADVTVAPTEKKYFEITSDINLANKQWYVPGLTAWLDNAAYNNIGFTGVIYGNGHTIYNFNSNAASTAAGLIPVATQGTEIYDLHLVGGTLPRYNWRSYALGGFIGLAKAAAGSAPIVIDGCSVKNFDIAAVHGAGGFIGYSFSQSYNIKDSYVVNSTFVADADKVTAGTANASAFVGFIDGSEINNSFAIENCYTDTASAESAQIKESFAAAVSYKNVYTANETESTTDGVTNFTADKITGTAAKTNMNGFNFNQKWQAVDGSTPVHTTLEHRAKYFSGAPAESFAGGAGTEADPYLISTADQLYLLALLDRHETYGKFYKLTNNITISNVYSGWANDDPYTWAVKKAYLDGFGYASSFAGTLDGAGYTVSGLYYNNAVVGDGTYAYGVIPFATADAVIKNITVSDVNATVLGNAYVGGVVGAAHVMEEDYESSPVFAVQFVGVNAANVNITANTKGDILGAASRGVKFELCNTPSANIVGTVGGTYLTKNCNNGSAYRKDVVVYNTNNIDAKALEDVRNVLLGKNKSAYVASLDMSADFDICDLVAADLAMNVDADKEKLVWSDEFNGGSLDTSIWTQSSTAMSTRKTLEYTNTATFDGASMSLNCYNSGKFTDLGTPIYQINYGLNTINSMSYKYGRLEMHAKIPVGAGAFPALWLSSRGAMGYDTYSEYSTEIDVFEVFGKTKNVNTAVTCIHKWYNDENGNKVDECSCGTGNGDGNAYKIEETDRSQAITYAWYTVEFEWTEDTMSFWLYKDGEARPAEPYFTATRSDMDNASAFDLISLSQVEGFDKKGYNTSNEGIFNQYMSIILTNHMYTIGQYYENAAGNEVNEASNLYQGTQSEIDANLDNLSFEIDYIRLYQNESGSINLK